MKDSDLRLQLLPLAVALVNTEASRGAGKCNTGTIADVTVELYNIVMYGTPVIPTVAEEAVVEDKPAKQMKRL